MLKVSIDYSLTTESVARAAGPEKNESTAGITIVATAIAVALTLSVQFNEFLPILDVPTPQKNVAGLGNKIRFPQG